MAVNNNPHQLLKLVRNLRTGNLPHARLRQALSEIQARELSDSREAPLPKMMTKDSKHDR